MYRNDLEWLIDGKLGQLPEPVAPATLLPRVLAAIEAHLARPWYRRAWRTWPQALQAVSAAGLLVAALLSLGLFEPVAQTFWPQGLGTFQEIGGSVSVHIRALLEATQVLRRMLVEPIFAYALAFGLLSGMAAAALGLALKRVAPLEGVSES